MLCLVIFNVVELPSSHFNCEYYEWKIQTNLVGLIGVEVGQAFYIVWWRNPFWSLLKKRPHSVAFPVILPSQTQQPKSECNVSDCQNSLSWAAANKYPPLNTQRFLIHQGFFSSPSLLHGATPHQTVTQGSRLLSLLCYPIWNTCLLSCWGRGEGDFHQLLHTCLEMTHSTSA